MAWGHRGLEITGIVLMAKASPRIMSENDSILGREIRRLEALIFSSKVRPRVFGLFT